MSKRSLMCVLLSVLIVSVIFSVSSADTLSPYFFRRSRIGKTDSARFELFFYNRLGGMRTNNIYLIITPEDSGKYSFELIDSRDNSVVSSHSGEGQANKKIFVNMEIKFPERDQSITYKFDGKYIPDNTDEWNVSQYTGKFTVSEDLGIFFVK